MYAFYFAVTDCLERLFAGAPGVAFQHIRFLELLETSEAAAPNPAVVFSYDPTVTIKNDMADDAGEERRTVFVTPSGIVVRFGVSGGSALRFGVWKMVFDVDAADDPEDGGVIVFRSDLFPGPYNNDIGATFETPVWAAINAAQV